MNNRRSDFDICAGFRSPFNRFFKRLFGDFKPKQGDLVLAKTGELLGIMVNNDYCALLKDFAVAKSLQPGKDLKVTVQTTDQTSAGRRPRRRVSTLRPSYGCDDAR